MPKIQVDEHKGNFTFPYKMCEVYGGRRLGVRKVDLIENVVSLLG